MPLDSELVVEGQTYMIRNLRGGRTFRQRMEGEGLREGGFIQIRKTGGKPLQVHLVDMDRQVSIGGGESKKIIIEVISHESSS